MREIKRHMEKAYAYISKLQVSGDNVEPVALARMELREAYKVVEVIEADARKKKEEKINEAENDALQQRNPADGTGAV